MREKRSMDFAWRFHLDNFERPIPNNLNFYYLHTKAERAVGPAAPSFYDMNWELVDLPHDYAIAGGVDFTASDAEGYIRRNNGWYRRLFRLTEADRGKRIQIQFDGVVTHATVWVNGHLVYRNFCGYTSFCVDITEFAEYGELLNEVSVYVDTKDFEAWWYEGAGIYRHVWMIKTAPISVDNWGSFVDARRQDDGTWRVNVENDVKSILYAPQDVCVRCHIEDADGKTVASGEQMISAQPRTATKSQMALTVTDPKLWSVDEPNLYTMATEIVQNGEVIDTYPVTFGFRTIEYTINGMFLNGQPIKLKGVCAHEDHANLGVAVPDDVREYRMRILKDMGCNAYRCSHNPPTPEVLDLCDRLGIMVMDENRWFDSSEEGLRQLEHMMVRDRNHPCIVMWSMANEEPIQGTQRGQGIMRSMMFTARKYDDYRPIMMAMSGGCTEEGGVAGVSDVIGINYLTEQFDEIHAKFPNVPLVSSEIGGKMLPYGIMGDGSGEDWEAVNTRPYFMGMFKWVAFGYRGESRGWPRIFSRSGIIEPTGEPKENTWYYKQMWDERAPFAKIWPVHWNWDGREGEAIDVKVYTNCDEAALYLNGALLEKRTVNPYRRTTFKVTYAPGELKAVAYRAGKAVAEDVIVTTSAPVRLTLRAQKQTLRANRTDALIVTVGAADENGNDALWAENNVRFRVSGPATLLAVSNDDPYDAVGATVPERRLFHGLCQLVLRTTTQPGTITVTAESDGLESAVLSIKAEPCVRAPHVELQTDTDAMCYFAKMDGPN